MEKQRKKKKRKSNPMRCPYCGSHVIYKSADGIYKENERGTMLYVCSNYPQCDAYVRADQTGKPLGSMANQKLRALRNTAHHYFDRLHKSGYMAKDEAYRWLAYIIAAPMAEAHIGHLSEYYCGIVIDESRKLLEHKKA